MSPKHLMPSGVERPKNGRMTNDKLEEVSLRGRDLHQALEPLTPFKDRLALVLMHTKAEKSTASKALIASTRVPTNNDAVMKSKFKYLKEFDIKAKKPIAGIDLIEPMDSFGAKAFVVDAMVGISKAQPFGKDPTTRDANKIVYPPRFEVEKFSR